MVAVTRNTDHIISKERLSLSSESNIKPKMIP